MKDAFGNECDGNGRLMSYYEPSKPVESVSPPAQDVKRLFDGLTSDGHSPITEIDNRKYVFLTDYTSKCAELERKDRELYSARSDRDMQIEIRHRVEAELERLKLERDGAVFGSNERQRQFSEMGDLADLAIAQRDAAESQLVAVREQLKKAQELFTHTNKQYRRFYWEIYKSEPTMDDGLYMRGEKMLKEMAVEGEKQ
jgi:hypothetical protein